MTPVEFEVPIRTVTEANSHEHWRNRAKRAKGQHATMAIALPVFAGHGVDRPLPALVTLTRVAPLPLDPDDNLPGSFKYIRDAVAKWIGVNDRKRDVVRYTYDQYRRSKTAYAVVVRIEAMPGVEQLSAEDAIKARAKKPKRAAKKKKVA